ncbi:hypothetical protein D3C75_646490 [compost metagenome]
MLCVQIEDDLIPLRRVHPFVIHGNGHIRTGRKSQILAAGNGEIIPPPCFKQLIADDDQFLIRINQGLIEVLLIHCQAHFHVIVGYSGAGIVLGEQLMVCGMDGIQPVAVIQLVNLALRRQIEHIPAVMAGEQNRLLRLIRPEDAPANTIRFRLLVHVIQDGALQILKPVSPFIDNLPGNGGGINQTQAPIGAIRLAGDTMGFIGGKDNHRILAHLR